MTPAPAVRPDVRVVTAAEMAALERDAIAAGVPARTLMQRAGAAAAGEIARRYPRLLRGAVAVHAGPGNNGGDAWVAAAALARAGHDVRVRAWGADVPRADDARFECERARAAHTFGPVTGAERLVVDGVLGTGARGALRDFAREFRDHVDAARADGATVVALDLPTGLDATTGDTEGVRADLTLTFGAMKRGLLVARAHAGVIAVLDIGLASPDALPRLAGDADLARAAPGVAADAHKGTRGKVVVVGGARGMAGAALLACDAALRGGAGMARAVVHEASVAAVQVAQRAALASAWPAPDDAGALAAAVTDWATSVLLGPGLGRAPEAGALVERVLRAWRGPVVVDADALNHFAGRLDAFAELLDGRPALLTPHPLELARLAGVGVDEVLARRFDVGAEVARRTGATVLLKGVPTVVSDGARRVVIAAGTPALATGGSGDLLGGIAAALLAAQTSTADGGGSAFDAGVAAALAHGRAGELATARRGGVRGTTLDDVAESLSDAWPRPGGEADRAPYPVLAELPAVPA